MITLLLGDVGSGKTLFLTIASQLSDRICYSNFKIKKSRGRNRIKPFKLEYILDEKIKDSDVMIDEFYMYMEARKFMSDINLFFSYFAFQSRKLNLRIFLSAQLIRVIDVRMREMINNVIECEKVLGKGFVYTIYSDVNTAKYTAPKKLFLSFKQAEPFYAKYNTLQIIETPTFLELKKNIASTEYSDKEIIQFAKKALIFFKKTKLKITKSHINIFCIENKLSVKKQFCDSLYAKCIILSAKSK